MLPEPRPLSLLCFDSECLEDPDPEWWLCFEFPLPETDDPVLASLRVVELELESRDLLLFDCGSEDSTLMTDSRDGSSGCFFAVGNGDGEERFLISIFSHVVGVPSTSPFTASVALPVVDFCADVGTFSLPSAVRFNGVVVTTPLSKLIGCGKIVCFSLYCGGSVRSIWLYSFCRSSAE